MKTKTNGEEPINPTYASKSYYNYGLTKREYFAIKSLQSMTIDKNCSIEDSVSFAIQFADELLKQLDYE